MSRENSPAELPPERRSIDILLAVLADEQRRRVLHYFREADDPAASVETLVDYLVEPGRNANARGRERARIRLHHSHLPKLAETTAIEYDPTTTTVRYRGHPGLEPLLETVETIESTPTE